MTRNFAVGINALIRRTLASRMAPCPSEQAADAAGLEGLRVLAEKRAAAAEIIAQEANAVRLRALLEAARGQTANRNIRSAEERFAAAKDEWEAVRQVLQAEPDPYAEPIDATQPSHAMPPSAAVPAWLPKLAEVSRRKELLIGGLPLVLLAGVIGVAAYLHSDGEAATAAGRLATPPSALALDASAIAGPEGAAGPDPAAGTAPQPAVAGSAAESAPSAQAVTRAQPVKVVKKKTKQQVVAPPPPRSRPEPEELASGVMAPAEQPRMRNAVE